MSHRVPRHLKKYVIEQNYDRYTAEDQAVWRYIMRQLKDFLSRHAHPCYVDGLSKTGIEVESIPRIEVIDRHLQAFGWGAVPVSGFIPPAAFMEFQALGFLPIASDMRTIDHILYTPAPDIVHEAAGHAPILIDPQFAKYLSQYAQVASRAIISQEDLVLYEAIRRLSDVKEDPSSSMDDIEAAEDQLKAAQGAMTYVSEAGLLGRMNWWTAEYGLIGNPQKPLIFGAGLLSSLGESRECLKDHVKKIPLDVHCVDYSYDITEPQPQLFVTSTFEQLGEVLEDLAERMAFRRGGVYGLSCAKKAKTVTTIELDSGVQVSGILTEFRQAKDQATFIRLSGPCHLSYRDRVLPGHDHHTHPEGYSAPLGSFKSNVDLNQATAAGGDLELVYDSDIVVKGQWFDGVRQNHQWIVLSLHNCTVSQGDEILYRPEWGRFDLVLGHDIPSVYGSFADRNHGIETEDFSVARVPAKNFSADQVRLHGFYQRVRDMRREKQTSKLQDCVNQALSEAPDSWLLAIELLELVLWTSPGSPLEKQLRQHLADLAAQKPNLRERIADGLRLAPQQL